MLSRYLKEVAERHGAALILLTHTANTHCGGRVPRNSARGESALYELNVMRLRGIWERGYAKSKKKTKTTTTTKPEAHGGDIYLR
jgi:hypothetical protein